MNEQEKRAQYLIAAKAKVLEKAEIYARLKIFGTYVDDKGNVERYSLNDEAMYVEEAQRQLLMASEQLLHEMSLQADGVTPP